MKNQNAYKLLDILKEDPKGLYIQSSERGNSMYYKNSNNYRSLYKEYKENPDFEKLKDLYSYAWNSYRDFTTRTSKVSEEIIDDFFREAGKIGTLIQYLSEYTEDQKNEILKDIMFNKENNKYKDNPLNYIKQIGTTILKSFK